MSTGERDYEAWRYKKEYVYIKTVHKLTYEEAYDFCYGKGLALVPYNSKELRGPLTKICYDRKDECWVAGRAGVNFCSYIDPKGNGGPYAKQCSDKSYAVCYGKWY
ncbi:hypothetical protein GPECTOR_6g566 [Gonium pectorale]|uniref:C-type lectin domain-containing protein n=1 Tax=Gonium pectorale TaxID=33097 RepID=A0A150GUY2_GONPE|nr:hypothetical protein GPECTOR_6g566 [Gonium pectorale]|eukprot:KXZ53649.1 hypothetical protein GPECTOR_6g566 [Gonium pectorale]